MRSVVRGAIVGLALAGCRGRADVGSIAMVHRVQQKALASPLALDLVRQLTEQAGPRLAGSEGSRRAVDWALAAMLTAGLSDVHVEKVEHVPYWVRGVETAALLGATPRALDVTALGGSVPTPEGGVEAEVVRVPSLEAIDALGPAAAGKIVFVDVHTERTRDGAGYGRAVPARSGSASRAAKLGAVAVLVRSIGTDEGGVHPHTGAMRYEDGVAKIPAAALSNAAADALVAALAAGPARARLTLGCRTEPDVDGVNVVGEVTGKERPAEVVLVGAHLDSWDLGRGAIDDGAGSGAAIAVGKLFAELPVGPKRTVRVVLFANEENGLRGARAYAEAHAKELERHVLAVEADLGAGAPWGLAFRAGEGAEIAAKVEAITHAVAPLGVAPADHAHGGADVSPLLARGVPIADLHQDATRYFDVHHTAADVMSAVDPDGLAHLVATLFSVAFGAAEMRGDLGRVPEAARAE